MTNNPQDNRDRPAAEGGLASLIGKVAPPTPIGPDPRARTPLTTREKGPNPTALQLCPLCHAPLRRTADRCPACGAERHFGPTRAQTVRSLLVGTAVACAAGVALLGASPYVAALGLAGALTGFYTAHARSAGDHWRR